MDKDYIQYSKKVTKWAMILIAIVMIACLSIVAFCGLAEYSISAVVSLFGTFGTVLGVIVGAYQGNSSIEKYTKAKYDQPTEGETENESSNG